ncbi:hypothetical protein MHH70_12440 [Metasolibacillus sp. FSL H7-0170]|uniref:hypothetical protein n=1 Tax=Metasolibacillus sp. FSL H7-0170 TaxID=2921431 RepID=UPI003159865E
MERLTEKDNIGAFHYRLKRKHKSNEFNDYDAFFDYHMAVKRLGELEDLLEPIPADEWHEDDGDVIWWKFPIDEPPYLGSPLDKKFRFDYYTHFTRFLIPLGYGG